MFPQNLSFFPSSIFILDFQYSGHHDSLLSSILHYCSYTAMLVEHSLHPKVRVNSESTNTKAAPPPPSKLSPWTSTGPVCWHISEERKGSGEPKKEQIGSHRQWCCWDPPFPIASFHPWHTPIAKWVTLVEASEAAAAACFEGDALQTTVLMWMLPSLNM